MFICVYLDLVYSHLIGKLPEVDTSKTRCHCENSKTLKKPCECTDNREFRRECPKTCHESCTNRRIADHVGMAQLKRASLKSGKGYGVFAQEVIFPNDFVGEYVGVVKSYAQYMRECDADASNYCMQLDDAKEFIVDARYYGNLSEK